ncbi:MAG: tetratricopeptide repeat protein, partial [Flavobacteriales bacterium]
MKYFFKGLKIAKENGFEYNEASLYNNIATIYKEQNESAKALEFYLNALELYKKNEINRNLQYAYNNIGMIYSDKKNYFKAFEYLFKALEIAKKHNNKWNIAKIYDNIGLVYKKKGNYPKSIGYYVKALTIRKKLGIKKGLANTYSNLASLLFTVKDEKELTQEVIIERIRLKEDFALDTSFQDINKIEDKGKLCLKLADRSFTKSLNISKELNNEHGIIKTLNNLAKIDQFKGKTQKAIKKYRKSFQTAGEKGMKKISKTAANGLYESFKKEKIKDSALKYLKIIGNLNDTLHNKNKQQKLGRQESRLKWQQKLIEKKQKNKKQKMLAQKRHEKQKVITWGASGTLVMVLVFIFIFYNRLQIIKKHKKEKENAYSILDKQNLEITDSINYAHRIQQALMPP